jgi:NADPH2:quinone reductase
MQAVLCRSFAPYSQMRIENVPSPVPGAGELLITVHAAGVNFLDALMVEGKYQTKPPFPFSPGTEVAGVVQALGPGTAGPAPGTRVLAFTGYGGYAEQLAVPADQAYPIPQAMSDVEAAAFVIVYGTSYHALEDRAAIRHNETLVVLGAAGGVGLTAVEISKRLGARVIAAASSDAKLDLCRRYGADEVVNYAREDLRERIRALTGGRGADVVYDPVGGSYAELMVRSLAVDGRYLVIGFAAGEIPKIPLNLLLLKQAALLGVFWGAWAKANPVKNAANMTTLLDWYSRGWLRPHVSAQYPLAQFAEALQVVVDRKVMGKVVLTTG